MTTVNLLDGKNKQTKNPNSNGEKFKQIHIFSVCFPRKSREKTKFETKRDVMIHDSHSLVANIRR
jgi:hypothetical protein